MLFMYCIYMSTCLGKLFMHCIYMSTCYCSPRGVVYTGCAVAYSHRSSMAQATSSQRAVHRTRCVACAIGASVLDRSTVAELVLQPQIADMLRMGRALDTTAPYMIRSGTDEEEAVCYLCNWSDRPRPRHSGRARAATSDR